MKWIAVLLFVSLNFLTIRINYRTRKKRQEIARRLEVMKARIAEDPAIDWSGDISRRIQVLERELK